MLYVQRMLCGFMADNTEFQEAGNHAVFLWGFAWSRFGRSPGRRCRALLVWAKRGALRGLAVLPDNLLETLQGDRAGMHSTRINRRWRICFRWVHDVEVVGYH